VSCTFEHSYTFERSYTFENTEIASCKVLIATTEAVGDSETVAEWLSENLAPVTVRQLHREERPHATSAH
jgi:ferritin-like metal-binding protein YciE